IHMIDVMMKGVDTLPGGTKSCFDYFRDNYGITLKIRNQPTVVYQVFPGGRPETRHHVPELLSIGHDFEDLEDRIPGWQRPQVWNLVQPNCKNQLQKVFEVMAHAVRTLERNMPNVYPQLVEIETRPLNVTTHVKAPFKVPIR